MTNLPIHGLPKYSNLSRDDALFHYTTATGLIGILSTGTLWATAYYCANDEEELAAGKGVLAPLFHHRTHQLMKDNDPRVHLFNQRGVDVLEYAANFEGNITAMALSSLCAYITCFYKAASEEDFHHGLLSQWRGYGTDGGYALQFSRQKLIAAMKSANDINVDKLNYDLQDVHYAVDNPLKAEVLRHADIFVQAYMDFLDDFAKPFDFSRATMRNPLAGLLGGPLEALLDYLVHTKNKHFGEERECRLSLLQLVSQNTESLPVSYYNRGGLLVPYTQTPRADFNLLGCVEWIVVGPGSRMAARLKSVNQMVRQHGLNIEVRPSHIPFTRF